MVILKLPSYKSYWSRELHCPRIADVMPRNHYQELLRYLNFANTDSINAQDKLTKLSPLISIVQDEFVKIEPEEYNSDGEQIVSSKKSIHFFLAIQIQKSQKSEDSKMLFRLVSQVLCMTFLFMMGKTLWN